MQRVALDNNDRALAAVSWGGALLTGPFPILPGVIWVLSRSRRDSLALRCSRQATLFWLVVTVLYVPALLVEVFVPALRSTSGDDVTPATWFWILVAIVIPSAFVVSGINIVRAIRTPVRPEPPRPT